MAPAQEDDTVANVCRLMGLALITWQHVEDVHFKIYCKMLDVPIGQVASVAYYSVESFEARRRMVNGMAAYFLKLRQFKKQRGEWQELEHLTKVANENRNKFAHYALDYDLIGQSNNPDGTVRITFGPHRLRPTVRNFYSRLQGRTPDKEEHNLGPKQITQYIGEFGQLAERLEKFHVSLSPRLEDRP